MAEIQIDNIEPELFALLSKFHATTSDYLLRTFFKIFKIKTGPLYEKCARRMNNIIINNFSKICPILTSMIFVPRSLQLLKQNLDRVHYYSIVYANITNSDSRPVIIQYFDVTIGIRHGMLDYVGSSSRMSSLILEYDIQKVIGFCGDYGYKDAISLNTTSDHVQSLRILSGNKIVDLPYSDGFLRRLFDILLDYLPVDILKPIIKFGDTIIHLGSTSSFQHEIIFQYKKWLQSGKYILSSDYIKFIIDKFQIINQFMKPYRFLPSCVVDCFESVQHKILLIFMKDLYEFFENLTINDNNAVAYYLYLNKIRNMFQRFSDDRIFLTTVSGYILSEIDLLVSNNQLDRKKDSNKINNFLEDSIKTIDLTLNRAIAYIDALVKRFENFETYKWLLLDHEVSFGQVHLSFHSLFESGCDNCENLYKEVKILNSTIAKLSLAEEDSLAARWVRFFKESDQSFPSILVLVEVLLSFPCSSNFTNMTGSKSENITRFNMDNIKHEEIVNDINLFFADYLEEANHIINNNRIKYLED